MSVILHNRTGKYRIKRVFKSIVNCNQLNFIRI